MDLARRQQVHSRDRSVANSHQAFAGVHIYTSEVIEILEEGFVGGSHCELDFGQLRENSEETEGGSRYQELSVDA